MKSIITLQALAVVILMVCPASADQTSFRCGSELITISDTMYQIQDACGQPDARQNIGEKRLYITAVDAQRELETVVYVSEWIYKRDNGMYVLTFEGSRLVSKKFIR